MRDKGAAFVRIPGLTPKETAHLKEKPMSTSQMQAAMPEDKARTRLHEHRHTMVQMWGPDFEGDPRYAAALNEVRKGRYPSFVLDDFRTAP